MIDQWAGLLWQRFKDLYGQKWLSMFQGDEAIESWRVCWASSLHVDAEQIKHALSRLGTEFPEWPPTLGQFKAMCESMPKAYVALPAPVKTLPSPRNAERLRQAIERIGNRSGQWWTPERVVNESQVDFIIIQANRFGENSAAGRFLDQCKTYGCITADNRLNRVPHRIAA